jgi:hypothetical protein
LATPLRPRDRYFLAAMACAAAVGIGASAYAYAGHPATEAEKDCVVTSAASTMGSADIHACGAAALRLCRLERSTDSSIAVACRRLRLGDDAS